MALVVIAPLLPPRDLVEVGVLRNGWVRLSVGALTVAVVRLYLSRPAGGDAATLALSIFALVGCGGTHSGELFPVAVGGFLALAALARWGSDPGRPRLDALPSKYYAATAFLAAASVLTTVATVATVPPLHEWAMGRLLRMAPRAAMGFSDRMWLGSLRGMLRSDTVVMRLRGPRVDHLRGATYDEYVQGRWTLASTADGRLVRLPDHPDRPAETEIEFVGPEPERYFLPLGATHVALDGGLASREPTGILRPVAASVARRLWFVAGADATGDDPRGRADVPPRGAAPTRADRQVPPSIWRRLLPIGVAWAGEGATPEAALHAMERQLKRDYRYSLDFERAGHEDPIVEFLTTQREGHCEYFASAMVLLARSMGIPARVVGGYRVTEHNPVGDYYVVRERNAHAWVEAWVPGRGWQTYDPTPPDPEVVAPIEMGLLPGVGDAIRAEWAAALRALDALTWGELLVPLFGLVLAFALVRWWTGRKAGQRFGTAAALRCFERLSRALERRGLPRDPAEPIERYARRVRVSTGLGTLSDEASALLLRYSALRYGGFGAETELADDVERFLKRLSGGTRRPAGV
jgi:transglutaminase-like putative cysteine protease